MKTAREYLLNESCTLSLSAPQQEHIPIHKHSLLLARFEPSLFDFSELGSLLRLGLSVSSLISDQMKQSNTAFKWSFWSSLSRNFSHKNWFSSPAMWVDEKIGFQDMSIKMFAHMYVCVYPKLSSNCCWASNRKAMYLGWRVINNCLQVCLTINTDKACLSSKNTKEHNTDPK